MPEYCFACDIDIEGMRAAEKARNAVSMRERYLDKHELNSAYHAYHE